jgi:methionine sulfoxide reductase heme-binding subunit
MLRRRWIKPPLFLLGLSPFGWLAWRAWSGDLTANPLEFITHFTGDWAIYLILATLAVTPLRKLLNLPDLVRFRRMIGLFAFFYASLHFLTYLWLDKLFSFQFILKDVAKRPFITAGFTAFLCMVPLALTSTRGWIRRLGGKRWQLLHRLVYLSGIAAVVHYYWLVKSDVRRPLLFAGILALLLAYRGVAALFSRPAPRRSAPPQTVPHTLSQATPGER